MWKEISFDLDNMLLDQTFEIKWRMTEWCNYKCSYCIRQDSTDTMNQQLFETDKKAAEETAAILNEKINESKFKEFALHFIGGEVTFFDFEKIFNIMNSPKIKAFKFTTNFSNSYEAYKKLVDIGNERGVRVAFQASFHDEFTDENKFLEKAKKLRLNTKIEFVITEKTIERYNRFKKYCDENKIVLKCDFDKKRLPNSQAKLMYYDKNINTNKEARYFVKYTDEDGKLQEAYVNRDEAILLCSEASEEVKKGHFQVPVKGCLCSNTAAYVEKGQIFSCVRMASKLPGFTGEPVICRKDWCNLCGKPHIINTKVEK